MEVFLLYPTKLLLQNEEGKKGIFKNKAKNFYHQYLLKKEKKKTYLDMFLKEA